MTNDQRLNTLAILEASHDELLYMIEANRLTKEYNKKQKEYRNAVKRANADTEKQKHKIEKYKQLLKSNSTNGSIKHNTLIRALELSDKKIDDNEKSKKRAKYMSKSKGLNRDVLYKDGETSLSIGRKAAKELAKHRDNGYKDYLSWKAQMRDAKNEGNLARIKKLKENMPKVKYDGDLDDIKAGLDNIDKFKSKIKEMGQAAKNKQVKFKDQNGKRRSYVKDDLFNLTTDKKDSGNVLVMQKKAKEIDRDIDFKKRMELYKPTGNTDRANLNSMSSERLKELREQFRKDRKEFIRRLDIRNSHYSGSGPDPKNERNTLIKKFENQWWEKLNH